jgi:hypothetical protein
VGGTFELLSVAPGGADAVAGVEVSSVHRGLSLFCFIRLLKDDDCGGGGSCKVVGRGFFIAEADTGDVPVPIEQFAQFRLSCFAREIG